MEELSDREFIIQEIILQCVGKKNLQNAYCLKEKHFNLNADEKERVNLKIKQSYGQKVT